MILASLSCTNPRAYHAPSSALEIAVHVQMPRKTRLHITAPFEASLLRLVRPGCRYLLEREQLTCARDCSAKCDVRLHMAAPFEASLLRLVRPGCRYLLAREQLTYARHYSVRRKATSPPAPYSNTLA